VRLLARQKESSGRDDAFPRDAPQPIQASNSMHGLSFACVAQARLPTHRINGGRILSRKCTEASA
jgi:hypothetical protein